MPNSRVYFEDARGQSTSQAAFSVMGGGVSTRNLRIGTSSAPITSARQIWEGIREILGDVGTNTTGDAATLAKLRRQPPIADPLYPWLYAESIGNIYGIGRPSQASANLFGQVAGDTLDHLTWYDLWRFQGVKFTQRPYEVLSDDMIPGGTLTYHKPDGTTVQRKWAAEHLRWTDWEILPAGEYLVADAGQFVFDAPTETDIDGHEAGKGQLRIFLRKRSVRCTWYNVPFSYVSRDYSSTETWIQEAIGTINQDDFHIFPKGTLALEGVVAQRYSRFLPKVKQFTPPLGGITQQTFTSEKLANVTFIWSYFNPTRAAAPAAAPSPPGSTQVVQQGHNLVYFAHVLDGAFYVKTRIPGHAASNNRPIWSSYPHILCFSNPDA
jgi:hypothetical protein